jgi:uracil-DNA glycosylase family 4
MTDSDVALLGTTAAGRTQKKLDQLALSWRSCTDCALCHSRQRVVFYRGNPDASLAIVGEAPGHDEDLRGVPFIGSSGRVIDGLLTEAKVAFADVCFLNMVGCRPPNNRAPNAVELLACKPRTRAMLSAIDPDCILMLGLTAAKLAGVTSIGPWRGRPVDVDLGKHGRERGRARGVVTYHPSYLLRQGNSAKVRRHMLHDIRIASALAKGAP